MTAGAAVGVVVKGYPRLSETFIARELLSLEEAGVDLIIVSLRHPTDPQVHAINRRITAPVVYLPEYLHHESSRVVHAWTSVRRWPRYRAARRQWLADLRRDRTANRVRRWGQALVLAGELEGRVSRLYAHFLHTPASVARYAAMLLGVPWSVSAHAKDIWLTPEWEKREKLRDCDWAVTCTAYGHTHLESLAPGRVALCYHGIDPGVLPAGPVLRPARTGEEAGAPLQLLSVGRAVPKKGFDRLLDALALLPDRMHWRWTHIGGGPGRERLERQATALGLASRIDWQGPRTHDHVFAACRGADLFVLSSRIAEDGDRDGLPNVLLEAASQGLCCLASDVAAVRELLSHGETGWLVPPDEPGRLAAAILHLAGDPALRRRLGEAACERVRGEFDHTGAVATLLHRLGAPAREAA